MFLRLKSMLKWHELSYMYWCPLVYDRFCAFLIYCLTLLIIHSKCWIIKIKIHYTNKNVAVMKVIIFIQDMYIYFCIFLYADFFILYQIKDIIYTYITILTMVVMTLKN